MLLRSRCPRGSVGRASFLTALTDCLGDSIPCWSVSKSQDRRPAERQRARAKKNVATTFGVVDTVCTRRGGMGFKEQRSPLVCEMLAMATCESAHSARAKKIQRPGLKRQ